MAQLEVSCQKSRERERENKNTLRLRAKANAGRAFPSGVFSGDASKVTEAAEKTTLSGPMTDGSPQIHPFFSSVSG